MRRPFHSAALRLRLPPLRRLHLHLPIAQADGAGGGLRAAAGADPRLPRVRPRGADERAIAHLCALVVGGEKSSVDCTRRVVF